MRPALFALVLLALLSGPAPSGDAVTVLQETRTRVGVKTKAVQHVALLKNSSPYPVQGIRVTVELYDYFGQLLWARTVIPTPASLRPGDTATLSVATPHLEAHRQTRYRFDYRTDGKAR